MALKITEIKAYKQLGKVRVSTEFLHSKTIRELFQHINILEIRIDTSIPDTYIITGRSPESASLTEEETIPFYILNNEHWDRVS